MQDNYKDNNILINGMEPARFIASSILVGIDVKKSGKRYYELEDLATEIARTALNAIFKTIETEAGTLVELPCKVGDTVWYVIQRGQYSTLCSTTVSRICIDSPNRMVIYLNGTVRKIYIGYAQDDNAFLTKADAEKRLKELRGEV